MRRIDPATKQVASGACWGHGAGRAFGCNLVQCRIGRTDPPAWAPAVPRVILASALFLATLGVSQQTEVDPAEPCFRDLPIGWHLTRSYVVPRDQTEAIGRRLGTPLRKLTNSFLSVHGTTFRVNLLHAGTAADATALQQKIRGMKSDAAFCLRDGLRVIEFSGREATVPVARIAALELGFVPRPDRVRYRVTARIACVDQADYMAFNRLSQLLMAEPGRTLSTEERSEMAELKRGFRFGNQLALRVPAEGDVGAQEAWFDPLPADASRQGDRMVYTFRDPPRRGDVPWVNATLVVTVPGQALTPSGANAAAPELTAATPRWPAADPEIIALARKIAVAEDSASGKVQALLRWLQPNTNIRSGGPVRGSRWGVKRVLSQKYGHCWDSSDCFVTFSRAIGIPCRQVGGWLYGMDGHVWAEVLLEGRGWHQVDPTGGGRVRCGLYSIPYFVTEDGEMPILYLSFPDIVMIAD